MFLVRLIYVSSISEQFQSDDLEQILSSAKKNNANDHITGMLCFNRKLFLQCLEGSRTNVNETYHRILQDQRHANVIMLEYKEIIAREFESWTMAFVPETKLTAPLNIKFSGNDEFNPYEMTGESAHSMMLALKENISSV